MPLSSKGLKVAEQLMSTTARERGGTRAPKEEMFAFFNSQGVHVLHEVNSLNERVGELTFMFASTALLWEQPKNPLSGAEASRHLFSSRHKTSAKDRPGPYGAGSFCLSTQLSILFLVTVWSQDICSASRCVSGKKNRNMKGERCTWACQMNLTRGRAHWEALSRTSAHIPWALDTYRVVTSPFKGC